MSSRAVRRALRNQEHDLLGGKLNDIVDKVQESEESEDSDEEVEEPISKARSSLFALLGEQKSSESDHGDDSDSDVDKYPSTVADDTLKAETEEIKITREIDIDAGENNDNLHEDEGDDPPITPKKVSLQSRRATFHKKSKSKSVKEISARLKIVSLPELLHHQKMRMV